MRLFVALSTALAFSLACSGVVPPTEEVPTPVEPEPAVEEPAPADGEEPAPADGEEPAPADGEEPAPDEGGDTPEPAPAEPAVKLPADLDPDKTKPGAREEALIDVYRYHQNATGTITNVLKTDPVPDVRNVAVDVLRTRWKDGMDAAGAQSAVSWCAKSGDGSALRGKCLKLLGDLGGPKAGAVISEQIGSDDKDVIAAANAACKKWKERFPKQECGS